MAQADEDREFPEAPRADYAPTGVDVRTGTFPTLKRALKEFSEDNMTDWAAALTYYGLLALFPALAALVSIIGLVSDPQETTKTITDIVRNITGSDTAAEPFQSVLQEKSASGIMFVLGLVLALNAASGYVGAFIRASNVVWETPEGRKFFKLRPLQIFVTLLMVLLLATVLVSVVLTGPVVEAVAGPLGIGDTAVDVWSIAKWPVLLAVVMLMFGVLFHFAPNVKMPSFKFVSLGAVFAVVVWVIASALFALYVANFGSYNKTYGTLGGFVALLVWVWITNVVLLLGMEINSERERSEELEAGVPRAEREIQLEPRDPPKPKQST
jgi:membrane protein